MHLTDAAGVLQIEFMDPQGNRRKVTHISDWPIASDEEAHVRLHGLSNLYASLGCQVTSVSKLETVEHDLKPRPRARLVAVK
jgi:hypothetical protein